VFLINKKIHAVMINNACFLKMGHYEMESNPSAEYELRAVK
jgi:hypothetical protein